MNRKQKEFWKQFCQSKNKDEETLKKSLFNGDLTKEEFEYVISCVIGPLSAPSLFYPALFNLLIDFICAIASNTKSRSALLTQECFLLLMYL